MINFLCKFYDGATTILEMNRSYSDPIHIHNGVLQGDSLSPLLFSLYISDLESFISAKGAQGVDLDNKNNKVFSIQYADDLVMLACSPIDLQKQMDSLAEFCRDNFMEVNPHKSKVVVFRRGGGLRKGLKFTLDGKVIDTVPEYIYLGVTFSSSGCFVKSTASFVAKADFAGVGIRSLLSQSDTDSAASRSVLYKSAIQPPFLYGSEMWEKREREQVRFFKLLYCLPRSTPDYIVRTEFGLDWLLVAIFSRALKWLGKLESMEEHRHRFVIKGSLSLSRSLR